MKHCDYCGKEQVVAKGLCRACYYRLRNTGTLEHKFKGKPKAQCKVSGCDRDVFGHGYCQKHYEHWRKYDDPISPFGYGERTNHPSHGAWLQQKRTKEGRVPDWDDFWRFVGDVGEKPRGEYVARRRDSRSPWGPDNFYWHKKIASSEDKAAYARKWRKQNPLSSKGHSLKKQFGITIEDYLQMYEGQDGKCAICDKPGESYAGSDGRSKTLVVDHCHDTKKIRKLLCSDCNKGLGSFKDSPDLLNKAIEYLNSG